MVVFVDLESDDEEPPCTSLAALRFAHPSHRHSQQGAVDSGAVLETENSSGRSFSAALTCYPVALSLSSHLDLNDLHSLSLTCRRIHDSLAQFSAQLVAHSLRCIYDSQPLRSEIIAAQLAESGQQDAGQSSNPLAPAISVPPSYVADDLVAEFSQCRKISACARDLVAECRRCGTIVCRNCLAKPPGRYYAKDRYRRLCHTCLEVPISAHLQPIGPAQDAGDTPPASSASSTRSTRSVSGASSASSDLEKPDAVPTSSESFTSGAFLRDPCTCVDRGIFLCFPCGQNLRANDVTYQRVWTWRSRYSTHIGGGLGTGLGTGNQGQKCGRGSQCLETGVACISWVEIDCSEGQGSEPGHEHEFGASSRAGTPVGDGGCSGPTSNRPGYLQQEIEGIGGVVKKKVKKRVKVGATVWEYEDERKTGRYLEREASGKERSWCGWCGRVCLGEKDRQAPSATAM